MVEQRFDRAAAERILQRAIELEDARDPAPFEGLSEATLREAAEELGIPGSAVARAAAEERLGVLAIEPRRGDGLVGPGTIRATRIVDGSPAVVLARADEWLRRAAFRRRRSTSSFAEYTRRTDPVASAQRALRSVVGHEGLGSIRTVRVTAEAIGRDATALALVVDLESQRRLTLVGGSSVAGAGVAASALEASLVTPWIWLGVPASALAGLGIMKARSVALRDVETTLEGALDLIESTDRAEPSPLAGVREKVTAQGQGLGRSLLQQVARGNQAPKG